MFHEIKLYQFSTCPFCAKVRRKLEELSFDYDIIEVSRDDNDPVRKMIKEKSGVGIVPVIEIDGKFMGESSDIIKWLEKIMKEEHA